MRSENPVSQFGPVYPQSTKAIIMVHGRGSSGEDIFYSLNDELPIGNFLTIAPTATRNTWYPFSFLAPLDQNEPYLNDSLARLKTLLAELLVQGYKAEDIYLLGFSQGACLILEFAARNATKLGGIFALSGGLIGYSLNTSNYKGNFEGTPVFLGCSENDAHIPLLRVKESSGILRDMGALVTEKIYPGTGHTIYGDEIITISQML